MKKTLALVLAALMMLSVLAGCQPTDNQPGVPTYTYNYAMSEFPTNWNYCTYQTATDAEILDYITDGFYTFDYNADMTGYQMVDGMAIGDPVDVTADYVGQFGIKEGDKAKAYKITLRQDLKWENGDPIKAADFVESAKRLLDPKAQNYRADGMYAGSVVIVGAEAYLKAGTTTKEPISSDGDTFKYPLADLVKGEDGQYTTPDGAKVYFGLKTAYAWLGSYGYSLTTYYKAGYIPADGCWSVLNDAADDNGFVPVTDETMDALFLFTNSDTWGNETRDQLAYYMSYDFVNPEAPWSNVGWLATGEYELTFIMENELEGFYLKYNLPAPLVHVATYDSLAKVDENGVYTNTYGTSAKTTMSYGPYKLQSFQADKQYVLVKNENYYGLKEGTYQTTSIVVDCVPEPATRLELFLKGKLDSFGLSIDYMDTYQMSDYTYYATGDSTFAITFNPDANALVEAQANAGENINKTILTLVEFRQAMSYALDRNAFCLATSPTNAPGFGLYSGLIVSDPENGTTYRSTEQAKTVLAQFWGVYDDIGAGKLYATLDEAIASITGYNLTKAQELFNAAYDKAIADGLMDADDKVEIKIGTPNSTSTFYKNGYTFLVNNYTNAVKGTKLEGKLTFSLDDTLGNDFSDALKNNQVDMLFGVGWTGSALDPYGLMEAYVAPDYQYDDSTDFTAIDCTITIDGLDYTTDCWTWYEVMNGVDHDLTSDDGSKTLEGYSCGAADKNPSVRLDILSALEGAVLLNYNFVPIMDDASASLRGMQIKYKTEEYIFGMGFGGVKYYTYNYSDAEWEAFVQQQPNGTLDYT